MQTIERLVSFGPRWAGAEGDEPTVDHLAGELRAAGREVQIERIRVRPSYHVALALLAALGVVGSVVSVSSPPLGVVILLIVSIALYVDLTGRPSPIRWLTSPRDTANVSSPGSLPDAPTASCWSPTTMRLREGCSSPGARGAGAGRRRSRGSRGASTSSSGRRSPPSRPLSAVS